MGTNGNGRELVIRRSDGGKVALHDKETGEIIAGQHCLTISETALSCTEVVVTFYVDPLCGVFVDLKDDMGE